MDAVKAFFSDLLTSFLYLVRSIQFKDIIDIAIVATALYFIFKFIRDRRAGKLAGGIVLLLILQIVSDIFGLITLNFIMRNILQVGFLAVVVLFQPELRSVLEKVGGGGKIKSIIGISDGRDSQSITSMITALSEAMCDLSKDKMGALVVVERDTKLGDIISSGVVINADVSPFLIKNIFFDKAPLHDGAMVIRENRIIASGCFLPLSTNDDIIKDLGTRHRAAIGMSENSDAVVVVVSEESGIISVAFEGRLYRNLDYSSLTNMLNELLVTDAQGIKETMFSRLHFKKKEG